MSTPAMFVAISEYLAPLDEVDALRAAHLAWLEGEYAAGAFLVSGRRRPPLGGVIVARAESKEAMERSLRDDPFVQAGVARYEVHGFTPTALPMQSAGFQLFTGART